ncbi:MAG: hypothetical protein OK456_05845 [Thaumarchaeota archaeon]|nr:hypothetical protein [Nitrososphaerota archaeon]
MKQRVISIVVVVLLLGSFVLVLGSGAFFGPHATSSTSSTSTTSSSSTSTATTNSTTTSVPQCTNLTGTQKSQLTAVQFGEVTTYALPRPLRSPNSITSAPDGSVWFGEVAVPGVAHLFLNGTLVEYPWPFTYAGAALCSDRSEIWGVVLLNGTVWATDPARSQLVGLVPSSDSFKTIPLRNGSLPRYLAVGPDQNLWFTETSTPTQIGTVDPSTDAVTYYSVPAPDGYISSSLLFYNSSLAYVVTLNLGDDLGQIFSFNPMQPSPTFLPVGGNETLLGPYSVAVSQGGLWVGEHQASNVGFYNQTSGQWTFYPTSVNPKVELSLPYYLAANGSELWFNEHDGNKMAVLSEGGKVLTEYSMSNISTSTVNIDNALTIAIDKNLVWFTGWTADKVGFVNASITPPFSISSSANASVTSIVQGGTLPLQLKVSNTLVAPLALQLADTEYHTSVPMNITYRVSSITGPNSDETIDLNVTVASGTPAGQYLLLFTVTDGLTFRSVYIPIEVTAA